MCNDTNTIIMLHPPTHLNSGRRKRINTTTERHFLNLNLETWRGNDVHEAPEEEDEDEEEEDERRARERRVSSSNSSEAPTPEDGAAA